MKLWQIIPSCPDLNWDYYEEIIVRSETKNEAIELCKELVGNNIEYYSFDEKSIVEISVDGEPGIITTSFVNA
jgi:hypothetical protein